MNVYDTANKLGYEIQDSEEYKSYKKIKNEVMTDLELKEKIEAFEKLRYDVQLMQYTGEDRDEEKAKKLEEMYNMLIVNNKVKEYTFLSLIYLCIRGYIETEAMGKAKYLEKEYMQEYSIKNANITTEEVEVLVDNFENLNKIGIPLTNFWLATITIFKIIILALLAIVTVSI